MHNEYSPTTGIEDHDAQDHGQVSTMEGGALGGPGRANGQLPYGLDFQLDSGHRSGFGSEQVDGGVRVYEMDYVPPGRSAMRLARIYVTGDSPCHILDRARGTWLDLAPGTEYWYSNDEALKALVAADGGGKIVFRIAHPHVPSGTSFDEVAWSDVPTVVEQVAARDVVWQPIDAQGPWPADTYAFSLSSETPASVKTRSGCLVALCLTVTEEAGADGQTRYRMSATEWYQDGGQGLLFAGWDAGEGVVLERADAGPAGSVQVARCALALRSAA